MGDYPNGKHPNSLANLKLIKKGEVRNPHGRPKGYTIKELVRKYLDEHPDDMKAFVQHFVKENRDLSWRMLEGNPPQSLEHSGAVGVVDLTDEQYERLLAEIRQRPS